MDDRRDEPAENGGATPNPREAIELPPPRADRGATGVDDHVAGRPLGVGHQPDEDLDPGVDVEHIDSPSQGVRPDPR